MSGCFSQSASSVFQRTISFAQSVSQSTPPINPVPVPTATSTPAPITNPITTPTHIPLPIVSAVPVSLLILPTLPTWTTGAKSPTEVGTQVTVMTASQLVTTTPSGALVNIETNFSAASPLPEAALLNLYLVDAMGNTVGSVQNNLNNGLLYAPTTIWTGPISVVTTFTVPQLADGTYYVMLALDNSTGPIKLTTGPSVVQDNQSRYYIAALQIQAAAQAPSYLPPATLDISGYHLTFDDEFTSLSLSDSDHNDGSRWYTRNEQCCMQSTDGAGTAMGYLASPQNPFALLAGGGLDIRLTKVANSWTGGVLTSVDSQGVGFSQKYGYFEMKANFPTGIDTWPAFWLLNTAAKSSGAPAGEIDIVEYIANPGFPNYFSTTLHDWQQGTAPGYSHNMVSLPTDGFHTYGMMWTATTMTFYYDGTVTFQVPTPSIMNQPYYLLVDLGVGSGWPTENTPAVNDMKIQYVRAYSK